MRKRTFRQQGCRVVVERDRPRLHAEIDEHLGWEGLHGERGAWVKQSLEGLEQPAGPESAITVFQPPDEAAVALPPVASLNDAGLDDAYTPAYALLAKAKAFDDRLVVAVERWLHDGVEGHLGKRALLRRLRQRLEGAAGGGEALGLLTAAEHLLGEPMPESGPERTYARKWLAKYRTEPSESPPLGAWSQNDALKQIFRHDRLLSYPLSDAAAAAFAEALVGQPDLAAAYRQQHTIVQRLCGPYCRPTVLEDARNNQPFPDDRAGLYPLSDSMESRLVRRLLGNAPVPEGFKLLPEIIAAIREGRLATEPDESDGWYAYQQYALAALLNAEAPDLEIGPRYREELERLFEAFFGLTRETHAKQLDTPYAGGVPICVMPQVSVEPLPELYGRLAAGYDFVRSALLEHFGPDTVHGEEMWDGLTVGDALEDMATLMRGAWATASLELGREVDGMTAERAAFRAFQRSMSRDVDVFADLRMMVPLYYDEGRKMLRVLAVLGLDTEKVNFSFADEPQVRVWNATGEREDERALLCSAGRTFVRPRAVEMDVPKLLDREAFRAICDREKDEGAIREAVLQA